MKKIILFTILTISAFTDVLCEKNVEKKVSGAITIVNNNPYPIEVVLEFNRTDVSSVSSEKVKVGASSTKTVKIGAKAIRKVSLQNGSSLDIVKAHKSSMKSGKITVQGNLIVLGEDALFSVK